jgi:hypothetical protein
MRDGGTIPQQPTTLPLMTAMLGLGHQSLGMQLKVKDGSSKGRILLIPVSTRDSCKHQRANFEKSAFLNSYNCTVKPLAGTFGARLFDENDRI